MRKAFRLCLLALLGLGIGAPVMADEKVDLNFSVSLRIDDSPTSEIERSVRQVFFDYLLRADGRHAPSYDIIAILASRGSFTDTGIAFPLWGDETELPSLLAMVNGRMIPKNGCELGTLNDASERRIFFAAFDPDNVSEEFAKDCIASAYLAALGHPAPRNDEFSQSFEMFMKTYGDQGI
jgi:hypothetical protein